MTEHRPEQPVSGLHLSPERRPVPRPSVHLTIIGSCDYVLRHHVTEHSSLSLIPVLSIRLFNLSSSCSLIAHLLSIYHVSSNFPDKTQMKNTILTL